MSLCYFLHLHILFQKNPEVPFSAIHSSIFAMLRSPPCEHMHNSTMVI